MLGAFPFTEAGIVAIISCKSSLLVSLFMCVFVRGEGIKTGI